MKNLNLKRVALSVLLLWLVLVGLVVAQDAVPTATITASVDALTAPETLPEGVVTVTYEAAADAPLITIFARLREGMSAEELMMGLFAEDPSAMMSEIAFMGSPFLMPGQSTAMTYDLVPGDYVLLNVAMEMPQMAMISVVEDGENAASTPPEADLSVTMVDFGYGVPMTIPAGEHLWRVENVGEQWHEMAISAIEPGTTLEDIRAVLANGQDVGMPVFGLMPMDGGGADVLLTLDLDPGTYAIICHLPDVMEGSEGHLHHELGMLQLVTVVDTRTYEDAAGLFTLDYVTELGTVRPDLAAEFGLPVPSVGITDTDETLENSINAELLADGSWGIGVFFIPDFLFMQMGMPEDATLTDRAIAFSVPDPGDNPEGYVMGDVTEVTLNDGTPAVQVQVSGDTEDNLMIMFEVTDGIYAAAPLLTGPSGATEELIDQWWLTVNSIKFTGTVEDIMVGMGGE